MLESLASHPGLYLLASLLFGLLVGSFLNVVAYRVPRRMEVEFASACAEQQPDAEPQPPEITWFGLRHLITPPSSCPACDHRIRAWENIPILSYVLLRGRCSNCGTTIGLKYPVVEFASGILTLIVAWRFGYTPEAFYAMLFTWSMIALTVIDIEHQLLPDQITLPMLWLGLLININGTFTDLPSAIIGAVAGYLSLWLVYHLFLIIARKEGMGYGDFKLFALFGAWLGWQLLPQIILIASLVGAVVGASILAVRGQDRSIPIPFGPYLAAAGWVALLWGGDINRTYLQLSGLG